MSGIVRKVDELGRIVIPKEIRKNLNIKNSDDLEILIDRDILILKKFYRLKNLKEVLNETFNLLDKFLTSKFIITDKENILVASREKNILNDKITCKFFEFINERKQFFGNTVLKITNDFEIKSNYYICPIIVNTDVLGSIVLYDEKNISEKDLLVIEIFIYLIKEKIE